MPRLHKSVSIAQIKTAYSTTKEVLEDLRKHGLTAPQRPVNNSGDVEIPQIPSDLTKPISQDLGRLYSEFTGYADWVAWELAMADAERSRWKSIRDSIKAQLRFQKDGSESDRNDQARVDPEFINADSQALKQEYRFKLIEAIMSKLNKDLKVISREITRRQSEWERQQTEGSINRGGKNFRKRPSRPWHSSNREQD